MATISFGVRLDGFKYPDFTLTFNLSTSTTVDHVGKAMTLDVTAPNTVRPAASGEVILGRLETFEDRAQSGGRTGAVALKFVDVLPYTGTAPVVGDRLDGSATIGSVKVAGTADPTQPQVVEVRASATPPVVVAMKL